jgi:hypothetical protein
MENNFCKEAEQEKNWKKEQLGRPRRRWEDNIVTYRPIARQRLGKHIPSGTNARKNKKSIDRQRISKHA